MSRCLGNAAWRALSDKPERVLLKRGNEADDTARDEARDLVRAAGFQAPEEIRAAVERSKEAALAKWRPAMLELDPFEVPFVMARQAPKGCYGGRGLPPQTVQMMYREYQRLGSLRPVAKLYHRSNSTVWGIFHRHGLQMNSPNFHARILFDGRYWTPGKGGYYRATNHRSGYKLLHRVIWEKRTSRKVPSGWQVSFRNGDNTDFTSRNLVCLPIAQVALMHYARRFPQLAAMSRAARRQYWKKHYRDYASRRAAGFIARGLRSDGRPRRRVLEVAA